MMKNVNLQVEIEIHPEVIWRLKLFIAIMRFAVWVGGFGGVEFEIPDSHLTQRAADAATPCPYCKRVHDNRIACPEYAATTPHR